MVQGMGLRVLGMGLQFGIFRQQGFELRAVGKFRVRELGFRIFFGDVVRGECCRAGRHCAVFRSVQHAAVT